MFLQHFANHLIVTPLDGPSDPKGWNKTSRELPKTQEEGRAVYFTPNGFSSLERTQENVSQFNSVYIDIDCEKDADGVPIHDAEAVGEIMRKKIGEIFTTIEPSFIVRTRNGAHFHFLLAESMDVNEESTRNYIHVMNGMVEHFNADTGAKGINRVLRVPGFKYFKHGESFDVELEHEAPENTYTLEEIAEAIGLQYPAPEPGETTVVVAKNSTPDEELLERMFECKATGVKAKAAWSGDRSFWDGDRSRTDHFLVSRLAFWTGNDAERTERLWMQSPQGQDYEKVQQREDYRTMTINKIIAGKNEVYGGGATRGQVSITDEIGITSGDIERAYKKDDWRLYIEVTKINKFQDMMEFFIRKVGDEGDGYPVYMSISQMMSLKGATILSTGAFSSLDVLLPEIGKPKWSKLLREWIDTVPRFNYDDQVDYMYGIKQSLNSWFDQEFKEEELTRINGDAPIHTVDGIYFKIRPLEQYLEVQKVEYKRQVLFFVLKNDFKAVPEMIRPHEGSRKTERVWVIKQTQ